MTPAFCLARHPYLGAPANELVCVLPPEHAGPHREDVGDVRVEWADDVCGHLTTEARTGGIAIPVQFNDG